MEIDLKKAIERLAPDIDERVREDFFSRMDEDYFSQYSAEEIAHHLRMSSRLGPDHLVELRFAPRGERGWDVVIVAFDYFSEFSILCGLLASFGLDIQSGNSYTFSEACSAARPSPRAIRRRRAGVGDGRSRRKIVDLFHVRRVEGAVFDESRQKELEQELRLLIQLLDRGRIEEARERVNRRLIESFSKIKEPLKGLLYPVDVRFDNQSSESWTVMEIRAKDTPAFLYAFSNALSMRGIYIHRVKIENIGTEAHDRLYVSDVRGRKIEGKSEQEALKMAVAMIKQFTHFLASAPDPAKATRYFDQLLDKVLSEGATGRPISFLKQKKSLELLARLLGTSDFLWEDFLRIQFDNLLPVLQDFKKTKRAPDKKRMRQELQRLLRGARTPEDRKRILNEYKDREMFRIDMSHLLEANGNLMAFSGALTDLAEVVLNQAYEISNTRLIKLHGRPLLENRTPCPFTICGLGKFGGREIGYASDIELMFVYDGPGRTQGKDPIENSFYFERLCQEILHLIEARQEGIFHIDLRLRPDGNKGPLANPIQRLESYYSPAGEAAPFERQALTKLRWVAGDASLGRQVEVLRDRFVYSGEPWDLKTALHLRDRQIRELVAPGAANVKYSPGGVIEIEYAVQYLQIMHGRDHAELRTASTLEALEGLSRLKIVSREEHDRLREAYLFLRSLIDALRIVRGNARDLVLPEPASEEFKFLARRLGYGGLDWERGARQLDRDIRTQMRTVHGVFAGRFKESLTA